MTCEEKLKKFYVYESEEYAACKYFAVKAEVEGDRAFQIDFSANHEYYAEDATIFTRDYFALANNCGYFPNLDVDLAEYTVTAKFRTDDDYTWHWEKEEVTFKADNITMALMVKDFVDEIRDYIFEVEDNGDSPEPF